MEDYPIDIEVILVINSVSVVQVVLWYSHLFQHARYIG